MKSYQLACLRWTAHRLSSLPKTIFQINRTSATLIHNEVALNAWQERQIAQEISKGVGVMSAILSSSKVHVWLFVPGNNDLYQEDPATISYYQQFISQLASTLQPVGIDVQDLCPAARAPGNVYSSSDTYVSGRYAFIGFNNASFKNNDDSGLLLPSSSGGTRAAELKRLQEEYVNQVKNLLSSQKIKGSEVAYFYVFYHIPEVDVVTKWRTGMEPA